MTMILCEGCDGKLGVLDNFALNICRKFQTRHREVIKNVIFEMQNVSGELFAKFRTRSALPGIYQQTIFF
jgi:hypothetical protein